MIMKGLNQCVCDECLETFYFTHKDIKEEYLGAMLTETYFKCPHCGRKYVILIEDDELRHRFVLELSKINVASKEIAKEVVENDR